VKRGAPLDRDAHSVGLYEFMSTYFIRNNKTWPLLDIKKVFDFWPYTVKHERYFS
jgi:hypothetical protein